MNYMTEASRAQDDRQQQVEKLMATQGLSWREAWQRSEGDSESGPSSVWSRRWLRLAQIAGLVSGAAFVLFMMVGFTIVMQSHGTGRPVAEFEPAWFGALAYTWIVSYWVAIVGLVGILSTKSTRRAKVVAAVILVVLLGLFLWPLFAA